MEMPSSPVRAAVVLAVACLLSGCAGTPSIDTSLTSPISNNDTYATLGYLWSGARSAIEKKREPSTSPFNLPLSFGLPCSRGGQGAYQGTLTGTKSNGTGSATLALTSTIAECQFDDLRTVTTISASGFTVTGTIAIANDTWGAISIRMLATSVTVNGVTCPGGVDVMLTANSPSAQPISTGTACGRTGAVALP